jgi:hypothetical protein
MSRKYFLALRGDIIYVPAKKMIINRRQCTTIILDENVKVTTRGSIKYQSQLDSFTAYIGNELLANGKDRYWIRMRVE